MVEICEGERTDLTHCIEWGVIGFRIAGGDENRGYVGILCAVVLTNNAQCEESGSS